MPDRSRTFSQLKEQLFSQNVFGDDLQELSIRDLIESIFQYGGLRLSPSQFTAGNEQVIGVDFQCLNQFASGSLSSSDVEPDPLTGSIKILRPGVFMPKISLSFTGTNNAVFEGNIIRKRVSEPDEELNICTFLETIRPNNEFSNAGGFDSLEVEADDVLEYAIKSDSPSNEFQLRAGQFYVRRIG